MERIGGMIGNPDFATIEWNDEQLQVLKDMGMNFVQMNIAWSNIPGGEPLNLEHMSDEMIQTFQYRIRQLKKFGMKGMPHFGMPRLKMTQHSGNLTPYMTPACIQETETFDTNWRMMEKLMKACPEIDDYMFYTYDQFAWICSEFGNCPKCSGVPLDERLPKFINNFKSNMRKLNKKAVFWWQPWELSLGQIVEILYKIEPENFGLMLNTSGTESYFNNLDNYWIRCIGRVAEELNIPIIGEIQTAGSGVGGVPLQRVSCPSLVKRQIEIVKHLPTFIGIKEHYGYVFEKFSSNMLFLTEYLKDTEADTNILLERTALHYGKETVPYLVRAWQLSEAAMDFIPFEFTYAYSNICGYTPEHDFNVPKISGVHADTPAWESDRRSFFMITHDMNYHPWALENAALKFKQAGLRLQKCCDLMEQALNVCTQRKDDLKETIYDMNKLKQAAIGQYLYFKESLVAYDARIALFQENHVKFDNACKNFAELMEADLINQENGEDIINKYEEFKQNPKKFFEENYRQDEHFWATTYINRIDQRF